MATKLAGVRRGPELILPHTPVPQGRETRCACGPRPLRVHMYWLPPPTQMSAPLSRDFCQFVSCWISSVLNSAWHVPGAQ